MAHFPYKDSNCFLMYIFSELIIPASHCDQTLSQVEEAQHALFLSFHPRHFILVSKTCGFGNYKIKKLQLTFGAKSGVLTFSFMSPNSSLSVTFICSFSREGRIVLVPPSFLLEKSSP